MFAFQSPKMLKQNGQTPGSVLLTFIDRVARASLFVPIGILLL